MVLNLAFTAQFRKLSPSMADPFLGVILHWLGGLAAGSFYVPHKSVKTGSRETCRIVAVSFSWIICLTITIGTGAGWNDLATIIKSF